MKKLLCLGLFLAFGTVAHATTVFQNCDIASDNSPFPATPADLPLSTCAGGYTSTPFGAPVAGPGVGDTLNHIALLSDYRIFLEAPGDASVDFGHVVNNIGAVSSFNNLVLDPVTGVVDLQWGSGADISSAQGSLVNVFSCAGGNAAACAAIIAAMNSDSVTVTTTFDNVSGPVGEVAAQYVWRIDFSPARVPEPTSLGLVGAGMAALMVWRRRMGRRGNRTAST